MYKYEEEKVETNLVQMSRFTNIEGEFQIVQRIEILLYTHSILELNRMEQNITELKLLLLNSKE